MDLTKEESSFASKIMGKMGWSPGRGLGKNEDGNVDIIRVSKKNNTKGVGFKGNEMDWVAHQDDFEGLLSSLQNQHVGDDQPLETVKKRETNPVINLEEKSKLSRSRVHYHKAIKGKDLSKANAEDMSSILGLKKRKRQHTQTEEEEEDGSNLKTSSTNMKDYFSNKMKKKALQVEAEGKIEMKHLESKPLDKNENKVNNFKKCERESESSFYKNLNFLNIVSHNLRTERYRRLATRMPEFCKSLQEMYEDNVFPGSNFLYIKGYGNW